VTTADCKTLRAYSFTVSRETTALRVDLRFAPLYCTDAELNRQRVRGAIVEYLGSAATQRPELIEQQLARSEFAAAARRMRNHLNFNVYDPSWRFRGRWDFSSRDSVAVLATSGCRWRRGEPGG